MIADIILILVMALCVFLGYTRGLIKVAVKIIGFFAALIIALIFYTPVSDYIINNTDIVENLEHTIEGKLYNKPEENTNNDLMGSIENYANEAKEEGSRYIAENVAIGVVRVRNMDRIIHSRENSYDIHKDICKYTRKDTIYKAI